LIRATKETRAGRKYRDLQREARRTDISLGGRIKTAKLFKNGEGQAVRLPREFRFTGDEVFIKRIGSAVILLPEAKSWDTLIDSLGKFPDDCMDDRQQPSGKNERESH
jgi:antitoxin VapB